MRLIAFVIESASVKPVLLHLALPAEAPSLAPARGPPLGDIDQRPRRQACPEDSVDAPARVNVTHRTERSAVDRFSHQQRYGDDCWHRRAR
jgi:hypothetical protein